MCECPAGKGPHATYKHIAAVLLMIEQFLTTGTASVETSCTEGLQTFHQPRAFYGGAPIEVETIQTKRQITDDILPDPRPVNYRNNPGFNDSVRNAMINYCSLTSHDLVMRYLYPKADIQTAQRDHDYLIRPFGEYWVDQALQVTDKADQTLEKKTRGQSCNKTWFHERQWRITASKFGEICKITDRRNIKKLCESLVNPKPINTPSIHHGKCTRPKH